MLEAKAPFVLWLTGLSGSGKSTLAERLLHETMLNQQPIEYLDGDELRTLLNLKKFDAVSRDLYIRSVALMASKLEKNGISSVVSLISPFESTRNFARGICKNFYLVHLSTSLEACEARDPKGLYRRARAGEIPEFTGLSSPYETPLAPDLRIDTAHFSIEDSISKILDLLSGRATRGDLGRVSKELFLGESHEDLSTL
jgi:adenylylsulfate kinase